MLGWTGEERTVVKKKKDGMRRGGYNEGRVRPIITFVIIRTSTQVCLQGRPIEGAFACEEGTVSGHTDNTPHTHAHPFILNVFICIVIYMYLYINTCVCKKVNNRRR
jgi:hypothetical protein